MGSRLPASQFMHDWMHTLFANGVFNTLVYLMLEAFITAGFGNIWDIVHGYLSNFHWPARLHRSTLVDAFSDKGRTSSRKAKHLKCQASDGLSLVGPLAFFIGFAAIQWGLCNDGCLAFLAFADVVDFIYSVPRGGITPEMIRTAVHKFLYLFSRAFGVVNMHPKFHWLLHFGHHLANFGTLISCFVHERKHRMVKRYANEICNTRSFEISVLNECTCHHLSHLAESSTFDFSIGLLNPRVAPRSLRDYLNRTFAISDDNVVESSITCRINALTTCTRRTAGCRLCE